MLVLLVPTMIWVHLRVPRLKRVVEALCLLPLTVPAIVLVVGLAPIYRRIRINVSLSALMLFGVYVVLALPYAYRALASALEAIDAQTLAEAARSLGASWFTVMARVIVPNLGEGILNATLLTVALVLGEFTVASLVLTSDPDELYEISRSSLTAGVVFDRLRFSLLSRSWSCFFCPMSVGAEPDGKGSRSRSRRHRTPSLDRRPRGVEVRLKAAANVRLGGSPAASTPHDVAG